MHINKFLLLDTKNKVEEKTKNDRMAKYYSWIDIMRKLFRRRSQLAKICKMVR